MLIGIGLSVGLCNKAEADTIMKTEVKIVSVINQRFLDKVAMIESNFKHTAIGKSGERGAYQIKETLWNETVKRHKMISESLCVWKKYAHDPEISRLFCTYIFKDIEVRLREVLCQNPTEHQLYMVYNMGWNGAAKYNFNPCHFQIPAKRRSILDRAEFIFSTP